MESEVDMSDKRDVEEVLSRYVRAADNRDGATSNIGRAIATAFAAEGAEGTAVDRASFVYATYTKTTPERLWQALAGESRSRVTFHIEPLGDDQVKLTVIHDSLEPDGLTRSLIGNGWPRVLANLETLLETGEPLPQRRSTPC